MAQVFPEDSAQISKSDLRDKKRLVALRRDRRDELMNARMSLDVRLTHGLSQEVLALLARMPDEKFNLYRSEGRLGCLDKSALEELGRCQGKKKICKAHVSSLEKGAQVAIWRIDRIVDTLNALEKEISNGEPQTPMRHHHLCDETARCEETVRRSQSTPTKSSTEPWNMAPAGFAELTASPFFHIVLNEIPGVPLQQPILVLCASETVSDVTSRCNSADADTFTAGICTAAISADSVEIQGGELLRAGTDAGISSNVHASRRGAQKTFDDVQPCFSPTCKAVVIATFCSALCAFCAMKLKAAGIDDACTLRTIQLFGIYWAAVFAEPHRVLGAGKQARYLVPLPFTAVYALVNWPIGKEIGLSLADLVKFVAPEMGFRANALATSIHSLGLIFVAFIGYRWLTSPQTTRYLRRAARSWLTALRSERQTSS